MHRTTARAPRHSRLACRRLAAPNGADRDGGAADRLPGRRRRPATPTTSASRAAQGRTQGNDILAPKRAPAVAAEGGTIKFWTTSATRRLHALPLRRERHDLPVHPPEQRPHRPKQRQQGQVRAPAHGRLRRAKGVSDRHNGDRRRGIHLHAATRPSARNVWPHPLGARRERASAPSDRRDVLEISRPQVDQRPRRRRLRAPGADPAATRAQARRSRGPADALAVGPRPSATAIKHAETPGYAAIAPGGSRRSRSSARPA